MEKVTDEQYGAPVGWTEYPRELDPGICRGEIREQGASDVLHRALARVAPGPEEWKRLEPTLRRGEGHDVAKRLVASREEIARGQPESLDVLPIGPARLGRDCGRPRHGQRRGGASPHGSADTRHAPGAEGTRQLLRRRRKGRPDPGGAGQPRSWRSHLRQPDVRAVHGAPERGGQRPGGHGPRRDSHRQVVGDDTGRSHGLGRVLRAQGPSRVRPGPGGARTIGLQPGRLERRARGIGASGQPPSLAAFQR